MQIPSSRLTDSGKIPFRNRESKTTKTSNMTQAEAKYWDSEFSDCELDGDYVWQANRGVAKGHFRPSTLVNLSFTYSPAT